MLFNKCMLIWHTPSTLFNTHHTLLNTASWTVWPLPTTLYDQLWRHVGPTMFVNLTPASWVQLRLELLVCDRSVSVNVIRHTSVGLKCLTETIIYMLITHVCTLLRWDVKWLNFCQPTLLDQQCSSIWPQPYSTFIPKDEGMVARVNNWVIMVCACLVPCFLEDKCLKLCLHWSGVFSVWKLGFV